MQHADDAVSALHDSQIRFRLSFPDRRLVQFDCGKLQALDQLLRDRKAGAHRCLIFTQVRDTVLGQSLVAVLARSPIATDDSNA